jgi:hypothetical protein
MSDTPMKPIKGHGLVNEGVGYPPTELPETILRRYWCMYHDQNGVALCRCGAVSDPLPSNAARKRWHREHKRQIAEASA